MAHIKLDNDLPGIRGLMQYRTETAKSLCGLAETLLRGPSSLPEWERELIAARVSYLNKCQFCFNSHISVAEAWKEDSSNFLRGVIENVEAADISAKLKSLLKIAEHVQKDARTVSAEMVSAAKKLGATDLEIHDTVLIAAAFCMYNRYVDGLATFAPEPTSPMYKMAGQQLKVDGYQFEGRYKG